MKSIPRLRLASQLAAILTLVSPFAARAANTTPDFTIFEGKYGGAITISAPAITTEQLTGEGKIKVKVPENGSKADVSGNGSVQSLLNPGTSVPFSVTAKFKKNGKSTATIVLAGTPIIAPGNYKVVSSKKVSFTGAASFLGFPISLNGIMVGNGKHLTFILNLSISVDPAEPPLVITATAIGKKL